MSFLFDLGRGLANADARLPNLSAPITDAAALLAGAVTVTAFTVVGEDNAQVGHFTFAVAGRARY